MKFDFSEINEIDFENIAAWSIQLKVIFATVIAFCVFLVSYFMFISEKIELLENTQAKEQVLRTDFQSKYRLAASLASYRKQLEQMRSQFTELLAMLPTQNEMPGLLDDLTFVATDAGLKINSLNWDAEVERDFYLEFPINLSVAGDYHQLGKMVAAVAKLPRIVSLHDFTINKQQDGLLLMDIQARTYRFKDNDANNKGEQ